MSITIEDLRPKSFKVRIKGVELDCKPLRVSHALTVAKMGAIFSDPSKHSKKQIKEAELELDEVVSELMPELNFSLDIDNMLELLTQLNESMTPSENKELAEAGVELSKGPKG